MNHPTEDQILLLAYDELLDTNARDIEAHVAGCAECRAAVERIARARVALDIAMPPSKRRARWLAAVLAAAAVVAAVLLMRPAPPRPADGGWQPLSVWSPTAGYVTGGRTMLEIDAQLTRLEQERYYGLPN